MTATETETVLGQFHDSLNSYVGGESFANARIVFNLESLTHPGHQARIVDGLRGSGLLKFAPTQTGLVQSGETIHLFNRRNMGWFPNQYAKVVEDIQHDSFPSAFFITTTTATVTDNYEINLSAATIEGVFSISYTSDFGFETISKAEHEGDDGWWFDPDSGLVRIYGWWQNELINKSVTIKTMSRNTNVESYTDTIDINPEYFEVEGAYRLLNEGMMRDPQRYTLARDLKIERERLLSSIQSRVETETTFTRL